VVGLWEREREYFVEVRIGKEKQRTSQKRGENQSLKWNEKLVL
jgi:hypothetical protein